MWLSTLSGSTDIHQTVNFAYSFLHSKSTSELRRGQCYVQCHAHSFLSKWSMFKSTSEFGIHQRPFTMDRRSALWRTSRWRGITSFQCISPCKSTKFLTLVWDYNTILCNEYHKTAWVYNHSWHVLRSLTSNGGHTVFHISPFETQLITPVWVCNVFFLHSEYHNCLYYAEPNLTYELWIHKVTFTADRWCDRWHQTDNTLTSNTSM